MDLLHELYDAYEHAEETETALVETNKELVDFLESNVTNSEKPMFLKTLESIMKCREEYFFQAGFHTAKQLLMR